MLTSSYGLVTGRVTALSLDPSDATGNRLYVGTTGGGVWVAQNAAVSNPSQVVFTPLTDSLEALSGAQDPSISIGALTAQPGGNCAAGGMTGVILAGTGDPNDALDSYYGAGILRSIDCGNSWTLIPTTSDGLFAFAGEGFAGFAWSTVNPQLVVAAVSQAYEGTLVNAVVPNRSFEGMYYSDDGGETWSLATIADGGDVVQGPAGLVGLFDGNAATSVAWNPVRQEFIAAVRFHGYYGSTDGVTWSRLAAQPGAGLTIAACPTNSGFLGSAACPIFRGSVAVNPQTGDTFAWTVDISNQDQGLWQDACGILGGACTEQTIAFGRQWSTQALETDTAAGALTINNGDYNLALAAVPTALGQGADTWVLAGANDLWKCSLAEGCVWRNTTNATTCMSGQVAEFQHALTWSTANPLEILIGNDGGLWRSLDAIGETGSVCSTADATHFQNLNGGLGSLAEVESLAVSGGTQYTMMAGLGVNGIAGLKGASAPAAQWPQILGGFGGPVAIDTLNVNHWLVNNEAGVSIYLCSSATACRPADFGSSPSVDDADVGGDGGTMPSPAPFLVDPLDPSQLLIGTCRIWRGPASGGGWTAGNAISPILDSGATTGSCSGDALIRSMAAQPLAGGDEVIYVGMYSYENGGAILPGHILSATVNPQSGSMPVWTDLTSNPVTNSTNALNLYGLDVSSIFIDSHDATGNTVYVTVEGFADTAEQVQTVYRSTDGGAHWASLTANLPAVPVSSLVIDPQSASTAYVATDAGVFFTTLVGSCGGQPSTCWSAFGTGLPESPVVQLSAAPATASAQVLTAATYGRGIWQAPLWSASTSNTTATATPASLTFPSQVFGTASSAKTVTLKNIGSLALTPTVIAMSGDFSEIDTCAGQSISGGATCSIHVTFTPTATGTRTGQMTISANVYGGQLTVALSGTGTAAGSINMTPAIINFGQVEVGSTSSPLQVEVANASTSSVSITSLGITPPFVIASNACGTTSLAADSDCQVTVVFAPSASGAAAGTLTLIDGAGTQTVELNGSGGAPPTDILNPTSLAFPATAVGQLSAPLPVLLTNTGDLPLTSIAVSVSAGYQTSSTCGTQLAGHAACTINVVFAPLRLGVQMGTLTVADITRAQPQTVALTGTGVAPATLSVTPASLTFSAESLGVASPPQTLTITNTGGVAAANVGFAITGPAAGNFSTANSTCTASLAAGNGCTVQVIFDPNDAGGSSATLTITSSTLGAKAVTVPLNGSGQVASGLNVSPGELTFAATNIGSSSPAQTVTISNTSTVAASGLTLSVSPAASPPLFALTQNTCTATLAGNASCTVGIVFAPTASGPAPGVLTVSSATIGNIATVELNGTGAVAAGIGVAPAIVNFATTGVGLTSPATTVTVTNTGTLTALANLALGVPAGFQLVSNTCAATLAPGISCTAGVEFMPAAAGPQTGVLSVTTTTLPAGASVALQGNGFDFTVTLSGPGSQSVSGGSIAGYTLVLTPLAGSSGTFKFSCDSLPPEALCSFNPATETLNGGVTGNVAVSVSTGSSSAKMLLPGTGVWPLLCGLLLLPFAFARGRTLRNGWLLLIALGVLCAGTISCTSSGGGTGGKGGGTGGTGTTPAGTYLIPITVTSTGVSHSITVTLTVD